MQPSQDIINIKAQLLKRLPGLIEYLYADRVIHPSAHEYRIGNNGSISIRLADGSYFNHETGEGGDILSMIQHALITDFKGALSFAKDFIGNTGVRALPIIATPDNQQRKFDGKKVKQRDKAIAMIRHSIPITNTRAESYLRIYRSISLWPMPEILRFIENCYNYTAGGSYPAMIASISDINGNIIAAHCTFLDPSTGDKLQGSGIKSRLIFGGCRGGAIHLSAATDRLAICEGIEDGLSILQSTLDLSVWVTPGTSNMRAVQIPESVQEVIICADNDKAGRQAADDLSERLINEGKQVKIATPPTGTKDFNDSLRHGSCHV